MKTTIQTLIVIFIAATLNACHIVPPGHRGVKVSLGEINTRPFEPGTIGLIPILTTVTDVSIQQQTQKAVAECFSSDLQQVTVHLKVLFRQPENSVITIYRDYAGNPFDSLIVPRIQEAIKEVTALKTAANIVKTREQVKQDTLISARKKIGEILFIEDIVIEDIGLSDDLEKAIEAKMVQQQNAEKALFSKEQAQIDAETAIIKAKGEAESISVQSAALEKAPKFIELRMVEKWNGVSPQVVGAGSNIMLPITSTK